MELQKFLVLVMIVLVASFFIVVKICMATDLPDNVRRDGYCKINYGEEFSFSSYKQICEDKTEEDVYHDFSEDLFQEQCPNLPLMKIRWRDKCFKAGGSIS